MNRSSTKLVFPDPAGPVMSRTGTSLARANRKRNRGGPPPSGKADLHTGAGSPERTYKTQPRFKLYVQRTMVAISNIKNMNFASHVMSGTWRSKDARFSTLMSVRARWARNPRQLAIGPEHWLL